MEKKRETTISLVSYCGHNGVIMGIYWGYMGIMEKKMETTNGLRV